MTRTTTPDPENRRRAPDLLLTLVVAATAALTGASAGAQIVVGPWTFEESAFVDNVIQIEPGLIEPYCNATGLNDALTGYSPDKQLVNMGNLDNANDFLLEFTDLHAINLPGPDIVFFEARFSTDGFEIAVRPAGHDISMTGFLPYPHDLFLDTGLRPDCPLNPRIVGVPIELDDYGLAEGSVVNGIRIRALRHSAAQDHFEGDAVMAAVLNSTCIGVKPPREPSARSSTHPMRPAGPRDPRLTVERVPGASAYNVYSGEIGTWYVSSGATGSVCTVTDWVDNGDGTVTLDYTIPEDHWISVSAAHRCGESGVGVDSGGRERFSVGSWERCPPAP